MVKVKALEEQEDYFASNSVSHLRIPPPVMRNELQKQKGSVVETGRANKSSLRTLSGYLRIVSSGASTVASTVRSAASVASAIVYNEEELRHDQVLWAGFDKLECEGGIFRQVLLLGLRSGFKVWDVDEAHNVHELVSRQDGLVHFLQMLPSPLSRTSEDKFASYRPLLVACAHGCVSHSRNVQDGVKSSSNGGISNGHYSGNNCSGPFFVRVYSVTSPAFVHVLKFRTAVYAVRCSSRVVAVCQSAQIHCLNASTLEREYTILTNPIVMTPPGSGGIGYGPLAVGPRWLAYSGSPVAVADICVTPQHLRHSASFPNRSPHASRVALYAKESSKQLAAGIVTLRDIGYKRLSRYCSELLPDSNQSYPEAGGRKANGVMNGHTMDMDNVGMVIVRDIVSKSVVAQFRAHKSPISALCFDPSGTLLVTASVQGHNINIFKIMTGFNNSTTSDSGGSYVHLYRLQRGFTNAVIQDISFSNDSHWILIGTSRGTNHLFAIPPSGGAVNSQSVDFHKMDGPSDTIYPYIHRLTNSDDQTCNQQTVSTVGFPITLSAISRIRSGDNGWRDTVTGAAAAATGRVGSLLGVTASSFHLCKVQDMHANSLKAKCHLLVFSPSGSLIQYALRMCPKGPDYMIVDNGSALYEPDTGSDTRTVVEAVKKWNICPKRSQRENDDLDIYGENGSLDYSSVVSDGSARPNGVQPSGQCAIARAKKSSEEKHHLYIAQAEVQLHQNKVPFWANSQIYFHSVLIDGIKMDGENGAGGETEIEKILTQAIEVRPKHLVPAFDYLPNSKSANPRIGSQDTNFGPQQAFGIRPPSSNSTENGASLHCFVKDTEETVYSKTKDPFKGPVNNGDSPSLSCKLDPVNNSDREHLKMETQRKVVYNNNESITTGNLLEDRREHSKGEAQNEVVNNSNETMTMGNLFEEQSEEFD